MKNVRNIGFALTITTMALLSAACAPEVGSQEWCNGLKEKPKGEWTANELKDFTRHCILP